MLIVIEGIDGTGKSTHAARLADWFVRRGREVVVSNEPTRGQWGQQLRDSAATGRLSPEEELDLFLRDRREHVDTVIRPALEAGKVVILDRYYFSTMAYQGSRGLDVADIRRRNEEFAPSPDHLILLDVDVDTALQRVKRRDDTPNAFEQYESLARCREIFLTLRDEPHTRLIDASLPMDQVQAAIRDAVTPSGPL